jgi:hypothetical protein
MNTMKLMNCVALLILSGAIVVGQTGTAKEKESKSVWPLDLRLDNSGQFRVTLTGFTVNRQSDDNILESDGKGDEVYIIAELAEFDSYYEYGRRPGLSQDSVQVSLGANNGFHGRGNLTLRQSLTSVLMGDINFQHDPPRIRAGSASNVGGLRTSDRFPTNEPWNMTRAPLSGQPPMLLWEGELRSGQNLVMIIPTIWEWDGGNPQLRSQFTQDVNHYFTESTYRDNGFVYRDFVGGDIAGAGDRPIGMLGIFAWVPQGLTLNFDTALRAATSSPSRIGTGMIEIRYSAATEDYSLYFKVERLR